MKETPITKISNAKAKMSNQFQIRSICEKSKQWKI